MKNIFLLLFAVIILFSCSKKTKPTTSTPAKKNTESSSTVSSTNKNIPPELRDSLAVSPSSNTAAAMPLVVIDGLGRMVTTKDKLPVEISNKVNYASMQRAFTPAQQQNLKYRYKMIPPKILYVPQQYVQKSLKGEYCIYKQKFWYWKKSDGLFYLDETYYQ
jgi:hypothetical protein